MERGRVSGGVHDKAGANFRLKMVILGINAYHGDVSAVLLRDGGLVAAAVEERLERSRDFS